MHKDIWQTIQVNTHCHTLLRWVNAISILLQKSSTIKTSRHIPHAYLKATPGNKSLTISGRMRHILEKLLVKKSSGLKDKQLIGLHISLMELREYICLLLNSWMHSRLRIEHIIITIVLQSLLVNLTMILNSHQS